VYVYFTIYTRIRCCAHSKTKSIVSARSWSLFLGPAKMETRSLPPLGPAKMETRSLPPLGPAKMEMRPIPSQHSHRMPILIQRDGSVGREREDSRMDFS
jgi:hypothetical protein